MSLRESNPDRITCQLRGSDAVVQACRAARAFGEAQWLTSDECARLCIVIEELVANLFEHGRLSDQDEVDLSLSSEPIGIRIIIGDSGAPFDPRTAQPSRERLERGGGVGIELVRSWAQFVDYTVTLEGNRLELVLPL